MERVLKTLPMLTTTTSARVRRNSPANIANHVSGRRYLSHARTVVRECCKGDDESQWERGKFDPPPPKNPLTDGHQNLCR